MYLYVKKKKKKKGGGGGGRGEEKTNLVWMCHIYKSIYKGRKK